MGFYPPDTLVHEAQRRRIEVLPPCVAASDVLCKVDPRGSVRMGLGYVGGVGAAEAQLVVEERERGGAFSSISDLAARCGVKGDTLERLAWAGACDALVSGGRREALWLLGVSAPGVRVAGGTQLALPLDGDAPGLREMTAWERLLADYGSTKVTLREHPLELMRPGLGEGLSTSVDLDRLRSGSRVRVAGMVVARQRPSTANGVTFMLLEDEFGTINLIVPVPVFARHRLAIRAEPIVMAEGKLEKRDGVVNVVVTAVRRVERPDLPLGEVRHIEPQRTWSTEEDANDLRAVVPAGHSFGRRG
jgi:error-prone DNA polymerase